jgi:transposase
MRVVPIKSTDQQALLMLHRTRDLLIRQRTQLINALRAHLPEFGLVAETGREGVAQLGAIIRHEGNHEVLPSAMKQALQAIVEQLAALELQVGALARAIHAHHRTNDMSCRLETVPGIGVIGATAMLPLLQTRVASNPVEILQPGSDLCRGSTRLVARSGSAASPSREIAISRRLLVIGATAVVRQARLHPQKHPWIMRLLAKKPAKLVAVAVANKTARIAWAIMAKGGYFRAPVLALAA